MQTPQNNEASVPIRLTTKSLTYAIPDSKYFIPADWRRFHLSQLINKVLQHAQDASVPFDFIIQQELLRTSVGEFIKSKGISEETLLEIEYIPSILPPSLAGSFQEEGWISDVLLNPDGRYLTSSYANNTGVMSAAGTQDYRLGSPHSHPILSSCWIPPSSTSLNSVPSSSWISTAGMDGVVRIWDVSTSKTGMDDDSDPQVLYRLTLHESAVHSVRSSLQSRKLLTAGADGVIGFYNIDQQEDLSLLEVEDEDGAVKSGTDRKKRRRKEQKEQNSTSGIKLRPTGVLRGHVGTISRAIVDKNNDSKAYSAGWDHSVRSWSLELEQEISSKVSDKVILDMDQTENSDVVVTGSMDRTVCFWDLRQETSIISTTLHGHTAPVSAIKSHPKSPLLVVSGSYDSTLRIWDARSPKQSLFTIQRPDKSSMHTNGKETTIPLQQKILCVDWDGEKIISGGQDGMVCIHKATV